LSYCQNEKLQPLVAEIGWSHNLVIMERCKDDLAREFYLRMTRKFGWTKNVLIHLSTLPKELRDQLPAPEQVAMLLNGIEE